MSEISEHKHQVAIFQWAKLNLVLYPQLDLLFAIPNGGQRSRVTGSMLKAEGVKSGVPDMFLPYPSNGYHGLFIELKKADGKLSKNQSEWIAKLNAAGYLAVVAFGAKEAVEFIINYFEGVN